MPTVDRVIFDKNFTGTPQEITQQIRRFCENISPRALPAFVNVVATQGAKANECFLNVATIVEQRGGAMLYGWSIWEWKDVLIEAEHHAVWLKEDQMVDVTPKQNGADRILFLPDPNRNFDFATFKRIANIKASFGKYQMADKFIDIADQVHKFMEDKSSGRIVRAKRAELEDLQEKFETALASLLIEMAIETKGSDKCFCRSSMRFEQCCSKLIDISDVPSRFAAD